MNSKIYVKARYVPLAKTLAEWENENPILLAGEHGVVVDSNGSKREKIGDGVTPWNELDWWQGLSAYETAVENGFKGNEQEWLDSLKGEKGEKGDMPDVSGKVDKLSRVDVTDPHAYQYVQGSVPYLYGVYGAPHSDGTYTETQGLIKSSIGGCKEAIKEQILAEFESGLVNENTTEMHLSQVYAGIIPSPYTYMLDPHTIPIRDGNCAIPVGIHIYDEDENGNITNSKLYYGGAVPEGYMRDYITERIGELHIKSSSGDYSLQQKQDSGYTGLDVNADNPNAVSLDSDLSETQQIGAFGAFSSAFGGCSSAQGKRSFACGSSTIAKGKYAFTSGVNAVALGSASHAEGHTTTAAAEGAHAEGNNTVASGTAAHAEGHSTKAVGDGSHAGGSGSQANGQHAFAHGNGVIANEANQVCIGTFNANDVGNIFEIGNGTSGSNRHNAFYINVDGNAYLPSAHGIIDTSLEHAGIDTSLDDTKVVTGVMLREAFKNLPIYGNREKNTLYRKGNTASGSYDMALGTGTTASGSNAVSFGDGTVASGHCSFTLGKRTQAKGMAAQSIGYETIAEGEASVAEGNTTHAVGAYSHASGNKTIAGYHNQFVVGKFNKNNSDTIFEVGNGGDEDNRNTPFAVLKDGNAIRVGNTTLTEEQLIKLLALIG